MSDNIDYSWLYDLKCDLNEMKIYPYESYDYGTKKPDGRTDIQMKCLGDLKGSTFRIW